VEPRLGFISLLHWGEDYFAAILLKTLALGDKINFDYAKLTQIIAQVSRRTIRNLYKTPATSGDNSQFDLSQSLSV
jgi:hypothetical protein